MVTATGHSKTRERVSRFITCAGALLGDDHSTVEQNDPIRETSGEVEMMSDDKAGEPGVDQLPDELEQLHLVAHVERRGRLIEHEGPGLLGQRARDPYPLPLTPRERVDRSLRQADDVAALERGPDRGAVLGTWGVPADRVGRNGPASPSRPR